MLINSDKELRRFFPNVFATTAGEPSFYDKITPHLKAAEDWLDSNIVALALLEQTEAPAGILELARALVAAMAMHRAAPSLDLALTANGFVTAGTQTAVPISSQRMDRLMSSLASTVDVSADALLKSLHSLPGWLDSERGRFFAGSLFQSLDICIKVPASEKPDPLEVAHGFNRFLSLRLHAIECEGEIADRYISRELLEALRSRIASRSTRVVDIRVIDTVRTQVVRRLSGYCLDDSALRSLVEYIRTNPKDFPEWVGSDAARIFQSTYFLNEKKSTGYFF